MIEPIARMAALEGRDASHRAHNLDTHLTHGCMPVFRHFPRGRQGCAGLAGGGAPAFLPFFEGAMRTLTEAVS
jgi:hypothetical protein